MLELFSLDVGLCCPGSGIQITKQRSSGCGETSVLSTTFHKSNYYEKERNSLMFQTLGNI